MLEIETPSTMHPLHPPFPFKSIWFIHLHSHLPPLLSTLTSGLNHCTSLLPSLPRIFFLLSSLPRAISVKHKSGHATPHVQRLHSDPKVKIQIPYHIPLVGTSSSSLQLLILQDCDSPFQALIPVVPWMARPPFLVL